MAFDFDTDVLIVGAGPTGLMLAAQLLRYGIKFRLIDFNEARVQESRAMMLQARSMELIQNLGLADQFFEQINTARVAQLNVDGKKLGRFNLTEVFQDESTPYPSVYFIPQSDIEAIFISHLQSKKINIERPKELVRFSQDNKGVRAEIKEIYSQRIEHVHCRYLVACDGAKSFVRDTLRVPFEGTTRDQEFLLLDAELDKDWTDWDAIQVFYHQGRLAVFYPIDQKVTRMVGTSWVEKEDALHILNKATMGRVKAKDVKWLSRFRVHHRSLTKYQMGRIFLAGDAAHIHSPLGGQGMNTGLQDAANLAWKLAFVLKGISPTSLLKTYQDERGPVGQKIVHTSDRLFSILSPQNFVLSKIWSYLLPIVFKLASKLNLSGEDFFYFISQLHIKYHPSGVVREILEDADPSFVKAPGAGLRAPDAKVGGENLFERFKSAPSHLLLFGFSSKRECSGILKELQKKYQGVMEIHFFERTSTNVEIFKRYGVLSSGVYFIRPDGHIGFKSFGTNLRPLKTYLKELMGKTPRRPIKIPRKVELRLVKPLDEENRGSLH